MVREEIKSLYLYGLPRHTSEIFNCFCPSNSNGTGLNSINKLRVMKVKKAAKCDEVVRNSIAAMRFAAAYSDWNYTNKLCLLEAEQQSFCNDHVNAKRSYDASIASAKRSGFVHEQGLACEKAGFHCKRGGALVNALEYFKQARACYEEWGSSMRVNMIQKEIDGLTITVST